MVRLADESLCFCSLAPLAMTGIRMSTVHALLTESGALPDQVIDGTL